MFGKSLDRNLAKQDPEGTFDSPFGIVEETLFTRGEKIATLDRWRSNVVKELSAIGEERRARLAAMALDSGILTPEGF